jgi:hypothetical protein
MDRAKAYLASAAAAWALAACCGARGGTCARGAEAQRSYRADIVFSNLCDESFTVSAIDLKAGGVTLVYPSGEKGEGGEKPAGYADEIDLGGAALPAGNTRLTGIIEGGSGGTRAVVKVDAEIAVKGPATIEIVLRKSGDGCAAAVSVVGDGASMCVEPAAPPTAKDEPPC